MASTSRTPAIGIDLGTTYSCVGVFQHGKVEIIANDQGNRTTPSYVAFNDSERLVGDAAKNQAAMNPTNTIFDAKRLIGRGFQDETVQRDMKTWPFTVVNDGNKPKIQATYKGRLSIIYFGLLANRNSIIESRRKAFPKKSHDYHNYSIDIIRDSFFFGSVSQSKLKSFP